METGRTMAKISPVSPLPLEVVAFEVISEETTVKPPSTSPSSLAVSKLLIAESISSSPASTVMSTIVEPLVKELMVTSLRVLVLSGKVTRRTLSMKTKMSSLTSVMSSSKVTSQLKLFSEMHFPLVRISVPSQDVQAVVNSKQVRQFESQARHLPLFSANPESHR